LTACFFPRRTTREVSRDASCFQRSRFINRCSLSTIPCALLFRGKVSGCVKISGEEKEEALRCLILYQIRASRGFSVYLNPVRRNLRIRSLPRHRHPRIISDTSVKSDVIKIHCREFIVNRVSRFRVLALTRTRFVAMESFIDFLFSGKKFLPQSLLDDGPSAREKARVPI